MQSLALTEGQCLGMQEGEAEEEDYLEPAVEERDVETFDDSEFYQQLLKEFLEGSAVGSGAGALAASGGVSDCSQDPISQPTTFDRFSWEGACT